MPREMSDQLREAINQSSFGTDDVKQARQSVTAEETATLQRKIAQKRGTPVTDLTTTHLKFLLEQATPGPWEYDGAKFQEITTLDDAGLEQSVISLDRYTEKDLCNRPADMNLAAHAPELAEEVIRLRDALGYLMEETRLAAENSDDVVVQKRVADALETTINQILGDRDE